MVVITRSARLAPHVDVDVLEVYATLREEDGEYRRGRDDGQADDEDQRQTGEAQMVVCPDLLPEKQLEPAALRITP